MSAELDILGWIPLSPSIVGCYKRGVSDFFCSRYREKARPSVRSKLPLAKLLAKLHSILIMTRMRLSLCNLLSGANHASAFISGNAIDKNLIRRSGKSFIARKSDKFREYYHRVPSNDDSQVQLRTDVFKLIKSHSKSQQS